MVGSETAVPTKFVERDHFIGLWADICPSLCDDNNNESCEYDNESYFVCDSCEL